MRTILSCLCAALALAGAPSSAQTEIPRRTVQFTQGTSGATIPGTPPHAAGTPTSAQDDRLVDASARASAGRFNATGQIPCAQNRGQPMRPCDFGVARAGGGTAAVVVTLPDGRKRVLFFKAGQAVSANLSQADGNMAFQAGKEADLFMLRAGHERYEIPEAVIFGG